MTNYIKKIMILGVCTFILSGCGSKDAVSEVLESNSNKETAAIIEAALDEIIYDEVDLAVDTAMPSIIFDSDMLAMFIEPLKPKIGWLSYELMSCVSNEQFSQWEGRYKSEYKLAVSNLNHFPNKYSLIHDFHLTDECVLSVLKEILEDYDSRDAAELAEYEFTSEDIDVILHGSEEEIIARFASEYSIAIGSHIYSPQWIYLHMPEQYTQVGITKEMVREKIAAYSKIPLPYEARIAFQNKISDFLEEEITFDDTYINKNYGGMFYQFKGQTITVDDEEYDMAWLTANSIQAYERAGITTDMLEDLLERIAEQSDTKEYDWIYSCLVRMKEME